MSELEVRHPGSERGGRWPEIYERTLDCIHCGLCLESCPTYRETGLEISSPRGRIYLLRSIAEGRAEPGELLAHEAFLCLACRACETACPSGVEFGALIELARAEVVSTGLRRDLASRIERLVLRLLLPHPKRLHWLVGLMDLARRLGVMRLLMALAPRRLARMEALLPPIPSREDRKPLPEMNPAVGATRGRVGFLSGCVMPELFGDVNAATVRVLQRNGFEVLVPRDQGCCGALHAHAGDDAFARRLARRNVEAFGAIGVDTVLVNSAGCGAALQDVGRWLPLEGELFAASVRDVAEFLDAEGIQAPEGSVDATVCYDDPCHLVNGMGVSDAPRRLLEKIPGVRLIAHADPTSCCGAAGTYNLTHLEMSQAILARKLDSLDAADPDIVATGNPGCLMQLRAGLAERGSRARVVHPLVLLDEAYKGGASSSPSRRIL